MSDSEILSGSAIGILTSSGGEITFVKSVCDQFHRSLCHFLKILLYQRRNGDHSISAVEYFPLHALMPSLGCPGHLQMLEIEYPGPGVPEVGQPRKSGLFRETESYHVH